MSLLTCGVVVGGEWGFKAAVFPHDGVTKAGMAWHRPQRWPRQALTWLREKKGGRDGAAARFAWVGVARTVNPTTAILRNAALLGEISVSQEVEKMEELEADSETLGEEARREGESARSSRSSQRQWRRHCCRRSRERAGGREWTGARRVRGGVASMKESTTWGVGPTLAYGRQMGARCCAQSATTANRARHQSLHCWLIELLWRWLSSKPWQIKRWCSWHSCSTNSYRPGRKDMELPKSITQTGGARS